MNKQFKQEQPWRLWIRGRLYETTGELSQQSEESDRLILYNLHVIKCPGHANPYPIVRDITPDPEPSAESMEEAEKAIHFPISERTTRRLAQLFDQQRVAGYVAGMASARARIGVGDSFTGRVEINAAASALRVAPERLVELINAEMERQKGVSNV